MEETFLEKNISSTKIKSLDIFISSKIKLTYNWLTIIKVNKTLLYSFSLENKKNKK